MFRMLIVTMAMLLFVQAARAQDGKNNTPLWVQAMNDPNTNYYEAVRSFNQYWKDKELPVEEAELLNQEIDRKERREIRRTIRKMKKMSPAERQQFDWLAYQHKRFKNWQREVLPYVQEDGHILTMAERTAIWEEQQRAASQR